RIVRARSDRFPQAFRRSLHLASRGPLMKPGDLAPPNAYRLLWAGFMAILTSGVGFSIRAGILGQWAEQYGFTQTELGAITGGGLTGFGLILLIGRLIGAP